LMALTIPLIFVSYFYPENSMLLTIRILFAIYFIGQATLGTIDYFRKGFTNGASDNATGVVAAIATAQKLKNQLSHTAIEVVLTNAEEVGMVGALAYQKKFFKEEGATYLINFDTLGQGDLKIITKTGSFTTVRYENEVTVAAESITKTDPRFANVATGSWHTADFDSVWFVRAGVACLTLAALDANGLMPNIHRPNDTLDNIDTQPMLQAIELAEAIGLKLCQ
jgi:Zn-dependent M28 family amino/carboxypeptidase